MKTTIYTAMLVLLGAGVFLTGCGSEDPVPPPGGDSAEDGTSQTTTVPATDDSVTSAESAERKKLETAVKKLSDKQLLGEAQKYVNAARAQEADAEALARKLQQMSLADAMGPRKDEIQQEADRIAKESEEIQKQLEAYLKEMSARNMDIQQLNWEADKP